MKRILAFWLFASVATANVAIYNSFTSGELSPYLDARVDFERYGSGCRTVENFITLPYGGVNKRSGTQYITTTKSNGFVRLEGFSIGVDQSYIMEFGEQYARFFGNGQQLLTTSSVPVEVVTPYHAEDVMALQFAKFGDTIYITHPSYPVYKLQRTSITPTFTMEKVVWYWPPVLDQNVEDITVTPSATTGSITLTSSASLFTTNHVDSSWVLRSDRASAQISVSLAANATSSALKVEGDWNLKTVGTWNGSLYIQISEDNGVTWGDYKVYTSANTASPINYDRSGKEPEANVKYRLKSVVSGTTSGTGTLLNESPYINGWVTITNYLSATQVQAVVGSELGSTSPTKAWSEAAFSAERGYPRCGTFFENRLFFAGTDNDVNTIWASMTDDYENFRLGTYDDSALQFTINSDNIIEWMLGRGALYIGTLGDEWILNGGSSAVALTPTSVNAKKQTGFGSQDGMPAVVASDSMLYLQRQGRKVRDLSYSLEQDSYKSDDLTILAQHITEGGVVQMAIQQQPEPIIWCIRKDGQLLGMTYNKTQNITAWHRQTTDGYFDSVACIPTTGEDEVYASVLRQINGSDVRYIERFRPVDWGSDDKDAWFVDSGLMFDGGDAIDVSDISVSTSGVVTVWADNTWTNGYNAKFSGVSGMTELERYTFQLADVTSTNFALLIDGTTNYINALSWSNWTGTASVQRVEKNFSTVQHLAGKDLAVFADGGVQPNATVATNGALNISDYKNKVIVGLPYTATISPMYIDVSDQSGSSYGKTKLPYKVIFRIKESGAFNYGSSTNALFPVSVRKPDLVAGVPVPFYSGDTVTKPIVASPSTAPQFFVTSSEPLPLSILSISVFTNVKEIE